MRRQRYDLLASLFSYPGPDYGEHIAAAAAVLRSDYPEAAAELTQLASFLPAPANWSVEAATSELQEVYTQSFEVPAITTLDVGYVVFGDDYKRAELLVGLGKEHRTAGIDCGDELADHLPNILRLLANWEDEELTTEFVQQILHVAVRRMVEEFHPERMKLRNALYQKHHKTVLDSSKQRAMMFRHLLVAVRTVLETDFELVDRTPSRPSSEFLSSIRREMEIEEKGAGRRPSAALPGPTQSAPVSGRI